jgi:hypothetical protein
MHFASSKLINYFISAMYFNVVWKCEATVCRSSRLLPDNTSLTYVRIAKDLIGNKLFASWKLKSKQMCFRLWCMYVRRVSLNQSNSNGAFSATLPSQGRSYGEQIRGLCSKFEIWSRDWELPLVGAFCVVPRLVLRFPSRLGAAARASKFARN